MERFRIYNRELKKLLVRLEPWGTDFNVDQKSYLSVHATGNTTLVEIECNPGLISVYLNGLEIDEEDTKVVGNSGDTIRIYLRQRSR